MELIRPTEVSAKILSLIEDAKDFLVVVSPYNDLNNWQKMVTQFSTAKKRGVKIFYYARKKEIHKGLDLIEIDPLLIENLHAKLYINEKYAIFSSMNLVKYSDDHSIDFAFKTETPKEYEEALNFFNLHIKEKAVGHTIKSEQNSKSEFSQELPISNFFKSEIYTRETLLLSKQYFSGSPFISEFGFLKDGQKFGHWHYFSTNGLLEKTETYFEEKTIDVLDYNRKVSRYDLIFCLGNVVGGLFNCSIKDLYFKSPIKRFTKGKNDKLYKYLESKLPVDYIDRDLKDRKSVV